MRNLLTQFFREEDGQDTVEYALVIGLIALGMTAGSNKLITGMGALWQAIADVLPANVTAPTT